MFALGMLVDSAGKDTYFGKNYTRGAGVHLSAGVCVDRAGDDLHQGDYGQNGMSLDRSAGVFLDLDGDDVYRAKAGYGFSTKPRGCSIFVDARGDDVYAGPGRFFGFANVPYGEDAESTAFFLDLGGTDTYPAEPYRNGASWTERFFGCGADEEVKEPVTPRAPAWAPGKPRALPAMPREDGGTVSPWTLVRFAAQGRLLAMKDKALDRVEPIARNGPGPARRDIIDLVRLLVLRKHLGPAAAWKLASLLASPDRDLRILGLWAMASLEAGDGRLLKTAASLVLADGSADVRSAACRALGASRAADALPPLLQALGDPAWPVRRQAALALGMLGDRAAGDALARTVKKDAVPEVRGRAAESLGRLGDPRHRTTLDKACSDPAPIVRFFAARALVKDMAVKDAVPRLFPCLRWKSAVLRNQIVLGFLKAFTGQSLPPRVEPWEAWWKEAAPAFDLAAHVRAYALFEEARKQRRAGDEAGAMETYRRIRKLLPRHAGACEEVAKALNSQAWNLAVEGKDLEKGRKLALESVDARADADNLDTLAVLQFLLGRKEEALETLDRALAMAKGDKRRSILERIAQVKAGALKLR